MQNRGIISGVNERVQRSLTPHRTHANGVRARMAKTNRISTRNVMCRNGHPREGNLFITSAGFKGCRACRRNSERLWQQRHPGRALEFRAKRDARRNAHGTHNSWRGMFDRCLHPTNPRWKDYGGRGITICDRWHQYDNFLTDMGERPAGRSLDRIDNNGNLRTWQLSVGHGV